MEFDDIQVAGIRHRELRRALLSAEVGHQVYQAPSVFECLLNSAWRTPLDNVRTLARKNISFRSRNVRSIVETRLKFDPWAVMERHGACLILARSLVEMRSNSK